MYLSNYQENASLDALPNTVYLAAVSAWPGETGGQTNLLSARITVEMDAAASGQRDNTNQETGTISAAGTSRVRFAEIYDAASAGNYLGYTVAGTGNAHPFVVAESELTGNNIVSPGIIGTLSADDEVVFIDLPNSTLPTGITEGTIYYVIGTPNDGADSEFEVSATLGGSSINITTIGSGLVHRVDYRDLDQNDVLQINAGSLVFELA